jgi:photosynthetic reaction center cytochrome c subunit
MLTILHINRKLIVLTVLIVTAVVSIAAINPGQQPPNNFTNLQVLPKDISSKDLKYIMVNEFDNGLGVKCNFCHAMKKDSLSLDFASDEKPEKEIARSMMRMTMDINGKYFGVEHPMIGDSLMIVSCFTCHHGTPHPDPVLNNK